MTGSGIFSIVLKDYALNWGETSYIDHTHQGVWFVTLWAIIMNCLKFYRMAPFGGCKWGKLFPLFIPPTDIVGIWFRFFILQGKPAPSYMDSATSMRPNFLNTERKVSLLSWIWESWPVCNSHGEGNGSVFH